MFSHSIAVASLLSAAVLLGVRTPPQQASDPSAWQSDVDVLLTELVRMHPRPFRANGPDVWEKEARRLRDELPGCTPAEAVYGFRRLVALTGDGHTYFRAPAGVLGDYLPVFFRRFADGWYVTTAHREYFDILGARVTRIGSKSPDDAFEAIVPYMPCDNRIRAMDRAGVMLRLPTLLARAGVVEDPTAPVPVTVIHDDGVEATMRVPTYPAWIDDQFRDADAVSEDQQALYRRMDGNYGFEYLEAERTLYFFFGKVRDEERESIAEFADRMFAFIEEHEVERLVIDIRDNSGGDLGLVQPLVHHVIRSDRVNQPGRLFAIIGRDTWSAAMAFAVQLERETNVTFVGEPTPLTPNFCGDTEDITLPASGIVVKCSSLWWQFSDPRDRRRWIAPDVPVALAFRDFVEGRDPALRACLAYEARANARAAPLHASWRRDSQRAYDATWIP